VLFDWVVYSTESGIETIYTDSLQASSTIQESGVLTNLSDRPAQLVAQLGSSQWSSGFGVHVMTSVQVAGIEVKTNLATGGRNA
jgi:hypothetical protein